jgi:Na+/H+ antiporter NhaD/arsenite permease-like protein
MEFTALSILSLGVLVVVYFFLITEKINKVIVTILGAAALIVLQVFKSDAISSQEGAFEFINHNLDVLGFIIGMMILIGIVRESGAFEAVAIWLVKKVKGNPKKLLVVMGLLTLVLTVFISNIPTILILIPIILILVKQLKLPHLPYLFVVVTMANIGGAATPISDPTTYYQAKTVGLSFLEVVQNSGMIVLILSAVTITYALLVFRKQLSAVVVDPEAVSLFNPLASLKDRKVLKLGIPLLFITIVILVMKEFIKSATGVGLDNASVIFAAGFLAMLLFNVEPKEVFQKLIDWEIIFFFIGLFIIIGSLEHTGVIAGLGNFLVNLTGGDKLALLFLITLGSCVLSVFIDNVPYNIAMIGTIKAMETSGVWVYPLWWALNLGTSIGGSGSIIGAACNVVAFGQAEKEKYHVKFMEYLLLAFPLVAINGLITFGIIWLRYY